MSWQHKERIETHPNSHINPHLMWLREIGRKRKMIFFCENGKVRGHTMDQYFKLIEHPEWYNVIKAGKKIEMHTTMLDTRLLPMHILTMKIHLWILTILVELNMVEFIILVQILKHLIQI